MTKKTKNLVIYVVSGVVLLVFTYGLTVLRTRNSHKSDDNPQYASRN